MKSHLNRAIAMLGLILFCVGQASAQLTAELPYTGANFAPPAATGVEPVSYCSDGCTDDCCGSCDCCGESVTCCCCPPPPSNFVFFDMLFLRATGGDVTHAQSQNGIGGAGTVPFNGIGSVDHACDIGYRIGAGIGCDACSDVVVSYTFFETDGVNSILPPTVPGGGGAVGSLVQHPNTLLTASSGPVTATQDVSFQLADILYRNALVSTSCTQLNFLLGAQYGHLEQEFAQNGLFGGGAGGVINTSTDINFDGGGLKIGLDGMRKIRGGVSVYGRFTAAAMSGQFTGDYAMLNESTEVMLARAQWKDERIISQIEYELGLSWTSATGKWHARGGYMFSHWGNVVTQPQFIDAVKADNYHDLGDTLSFDGAVARIECRW